MTSTQRGVLAGVAAAVAVVLLVVVVAVAARDDGDEAAPTTAAAPTTLPATTIASTTTVAPATTAAPGCPAGGPTPRGEVVPAAGDMDGDGTADTVYVTDDPQTYVIGVALAGGHVTETSHVAASNVYGPFDIDGDGRREIFVQTQGNTASTDELQVLLLEGCELVAARNQEGDPYTFLVGRGREISGHDDAGVGCVDVDDDGTDDLVGVAGDTSADGRTVHWTRTEVQLHDAELRNAGTEEGDLVVGRDDAAIEQLAEFTCGDRPPPAIAGD